jgi:hypothetical protein
MLLWTIVNVSESLLTFKNVDLLFVLGFPAQPLAARGKLLSS